MYAPAVGVTLEKESYTMIKQIENIIIFVENEINTDTGREYISDASIYFRDKSYELVRTVQLTSVVNTERELWEHIQWSVQQMIDEGYGIDDPKTRLYRTHKTCLEMDFYRAIGQHL